MIRQSIHDRDRVTNQMRSHTIDDVVNFAHADGEDDDNPMEGPIYVQNARNQCVPFRPWLQSTLELLYILRKSNASLVMYDRVMAWHHRQLSTSQLCHDSILKREKVFSSLFKRCNMLDNLNIIKKITLPSSHAHAKIITNSFQWCLPSLLTDPRIVADDYLFFDDNQFAPPSHDLDFIGDINTSKAYIESYIKYITNPSKQVLLPVIFYIDGAATGQFAGLPVTPLRFTLGIFGQKAHDWLHFWRTVGYAPVINGDKSQGARRFHESGHVESLMMDVADDEGVFGGDDVEKAQDLHTIFSVLLEEYLTIQERVFTGTYFTKDSCTRT
jgi:hypothetical protein